MSEKLIKKRYMVGALVATAVAFCLLFFVLPERIAARVQWMQLKWNRRNPVKSKALARQLCQTEHGIRLAVKDIDIYGGATMGWGSWILLHAEDTAFAEAQLERAVNASQLSKQIEANRILWEMKKDLRYPVNLYLLLKSSKPDKPPHTVTIGRKHLHIIFGCTDAMREILVKPASEDLEPTVEEWTKLCKELLLNKTEDKSQ